MTGVVVTQVCLICKIHQAIFCALFMYYVCYITMKSRSLKKKYKIAFFLYQFGKVLKKKVLEHLVVLHLLLLGVSITTTSMETTWQRNVRMHISFDPKISLWGIHYSKHACIHTK